MQCVKPVRLKAIPPATDGLLVPCGKCIACRIQKRKELSLRCLHELDSYKDKAMFVTLTYRNECLPDYESLVKSDLQKWLKRLRKRILPRKIRYLACGEYGDTTNRPHYHAIIFGLGLKPDDKQAVIDTWPYQDWNQPTIRRKAFGMVEPFSIQYVAGYIDKKYTGELADIYYDLLNKEPVFRLMSQGLGRNWADENASRLRNDKKVTMWGIPHSIPRYYIKRLELETDDLKDHAYERECKKNFRIVGLWHSDDELYRFKSNSGINKVIATHTEKTRIQHERNLNAKANLKTREYS